MFEKNVKNIFVWFFKNIQSKENVNKKEKT